jgi:hypothetical protein
MLNFQAATAISAVTSVRVPASPLGAVAARRIAVGTALPTSGMHTPAFLKGAVSGVRAWSPPV